jgi:ATP-dependent protease Clp ATPase subunit
MLEMMYEIPSDQNISKVIVHERCVDKKEPYQVIYRMDSQTA